MKKILIILFVNTFTLFIHAQSAQNENYYKGIESYRNLQLTSEQIAKIKELRRTASYEFAAIGKDQSLSGREKGLKKRERALILKQDIENVLTKEQITNWESKHVKYTSLNDIKDEISNNYESKLDALEEKYDAEISMIENNRSLSKEERKSQKALLKQKYKTEKKKLKEEKDRAKQY